MTLFYPKWIPGEHMASGPIANLAGLHLFADGSELDWRRDLVEVNAFHLAIPAGAKTLTAKYDYLVPTSGGSFGSTASTNAKCAVINWYAVGLYPMGENPDAISVTATLKAPADGSTEVPWISRHRRRHDSLRCDFARHAERPSGPAREHFRTIISGPRAPRWVSTSSTSSPQRMALQFPQSRIDAYKRVVVEERSVFAASATTGNITGC